MSIFFNKNVIHRIRIFFCLYIQKLIVRYKLNASLAAKSSLTFNRCCCCCRRAYFTRIAHLMQKCSLVTHLTTMSNAHFNRYRVHSSFSPFFCSSNQHLSNVFFHAKFFLLFVIQLSFFFGLRLSV